MVLAIHLYRRMMRRGRVIGLSLLASVPGLVLWLTGFDEDPEELGVLYSEIVSSVGFTLAVAALILTAATLREERDEGTLPYIYMRPIPRSRIAISAVGAGSAAGLTVALAGWLATLVGLAANGGNPGDAIPGLALFAPAALGYAAIFVPLGYLVPRSLLVGLGYIIVVETILANVVTGLSQVSIWRISMSVYASLADNLGEVGEAMLGPVTAGAGGGLLKLAGAMLLGLAGLTWALRARDAL